MNLSDDNVFDAIVLRQVIQFLPAKYIATILIPTLCKHLNPGGMIAIATFSAPPIPPFKEPLTSTWNIKELEALFDPLSWQRIHRAAYEYRGLDLRGHERLFAITELIVRAPDAS